MIQIVFTVIIGFTTLLFVLLLFSLFGRPPGEEVRARMEQYLVETEMAAKAYVPPEEDMVSGGDSPVEDGSTEDDWVREAKKGGAGGGIKKLLANVGSIITPKGMAIRISENLNKADIPLKANEFMAIKFLGLMALLGIGTLAFQNVILGAAFGALGFFGPDLWLKVMQSKKKAAFADQILDTLMMLANGMKAGYSLLQGMEMVAREAPAPMSTELKRILKENSLGMNLEDALKALNLRVDNEDWDLVTTVILIQRQVGGNLAEILDKIGFTIRQRMKIKGDIQTKTAQAKASGAMVGALPLAIGFMIYLINPAFIMQLFIFKYLWFRGWFVVVFGVIWEIIGMVMIMKICDIEI